jgi:hypothetical protein
MKVKRITQHGDIPDTCNFCRRHAPAIFEVAREGHGPNIAVRFCAQCIDYLKRSTLP